MATTGSTVIVTGGAGFIGSHLAEALLGDGHRVVVLDDLSSGDEANLPAAADLEVVDVTDADLVTRVVDAARPETVYHLAAQASVTASVADPARDLAINVAGTLHVLEAARRHGAPVVFASTGGALYGDATRPTPETFPPVPLAPYGTSKLAAEGYVRTWAAAHGTPHAVLRLGNVYGPRQNPHGEAGVVAIFSGLLLDGQPVTLFGDGLPTRDYIHVADVVRAFQAGGGHAGTFNIATGVETATREILTKLQHAADTSIEPRLAPLRPGEVQHSALDVSRAAAELGWRPEIAIDQGLAETFRWFERERGA